jgi:twitching motility protein PilI
MGDEAQQAVPDARQLMGLLAQIERRSRASALEIPQQVTRADVWDGLAYSIAGVRVSSAMDEIREMLPYPAQVTRVPGARGWMRGLANIRGTLLPVIDLHTYFGAKPVVPGKAARMLVIDMRSVHCGLLVPSVLGMRHFDEADRLSNAQMQGALGQYVYEAFSVGGEIWPVFSLSALTADPAFRSAAVQ